MFLLGGRRQEQVPWWIDSLNQQLDLIIQNQEALMSQMDDLRNSVSRNRDAENSIVQMLQGISQQLKDAKAQNDPAAIQDVINQIDQNTAAMAKAVTDNTPADTGGAPAPQTPPDSTTPPSSPPPSNPPV